MAATLYQELQGYYQIKNLLILSLGHLYKYPC